MKAKSLKVWNGRGWTSPWSGNQRNQDYIDSVYVCAESGAEAIRLLRRAGHTLMNYGELKNYFSPCWGNTMIGITPEKGVWVSRPYCQTVKLKKVI